MKKKNLFFSTSIFLLFVFIFFSCKQDGDVGPAGTPSEIKTSKEGFIKGGASGIRLDGSAYSYNLDFEGQYFETNNSYTVIPGYATFIFINKVYAGDGDPFSAYSSVNFFFTVNSLANLSSPV